jgi:hypothetical protein
VALQLAAYSRAERVLLGEAQRLEHGRGRNRYYLLDETTSTEAMPKVDGALALVVSPVDYKLVPVAVTDDVWRCFLLVRELARWTLGGMSRGVFGPEIAVP